MGAHVLKPYKGLSSHLKGLDQVSFPNNGEDYKDVRIP